MRECPGCGEQCAQDWCGFCERALPRVYARVELDPAALGAEIEMGTTCAFRTCDNPRCYWCVVMPEKFKVVPCPRLVEGRREEDGGACRFIAGHPGMCRPKTTAKKQQTLLKRRAR